MSDWHNLYGDSWANEIDPAAFGHPAKFAHGLIRRIYQHALDQGYIRPGESVIDPFGGVGLGGRYALQYGLHWTGVELESRFVELGQKNIYLWNGRYAAHFPAWGTARLLQGDSRQLAAIVERAGMCVSSPPHTNHALGHGGASPAFEKLTAEKLLPGVTYGRSPGQLGSMPEGQFEAAISSPPYASGEKGHPSLGSVNKDSWGTDGRDIAARRGLNGEYGKTAGQLAELPEGKFTAAISSPPYADAINGSGEGPGARHDEKYHNGDNAHKISSAAEYGRTAGNLGNLSGNGGYHAAVSSPPFESSLNNGKTGSVFTNPARANGGKPLGLGASYGKDYGETDGQIGNDQGETFWTAARLIVEQVYTVLRPGGYAIFVTGDFVRNRKRVYFGRQWQQLCEAAGFIPVEWIRAWKTEPRGAQLDIFGGETDMSIDRISFFRRLANEKNPDAAILNEDVIIMQKAATP